MVHYDPIRQAISVISLGLACFFLFRRLSRNILIDLGKREKRKISSQRGEG
jgi:alkylated DNA repair dioxygenase AlkB